MTNYTCARGDATRLAENAVKSGYYGVIAVGGFHVMVAYEVYDIGAYVARVNVGFYASYCVEYGGS